MAAWRRARRSLVVDPTTKSAYFMSLDNVKYPPPVKPATHAAASSRVDSCAVTV
jgi:hypothetical protein